MSHASLKVHKLSSELLGIILFWGTDRKSVSKPPSWIFQVEIYNKQLEKHIIFNPDYFSVKLELHQIFI